MKTFRPGQIVSVDGQQYKVMATNYEGKIILTPAHVKESISDMAVRLQSTVPNEESTLRVNESGEAEQTT